MPNIFQVDESMEIADMPKYQHEHPDEAIWIVGDDELIAFVTISDIKTMTKQIKQLLYDIGYDDDMIKEQEWGVHRIV